MNQLIFDEQTMLDGNIFKFEQRLQTQLNKYIENGALLTRYWSQRENSTTVDRGTQDVDKVFGKKSPFRYNRINNFPVYAFGQINPENVDELQIEDISVEGECIILPGNIVPKPMDFFTINHLKMIALFQVTSVQYDSMRVDGFYKIRYRLISSSEERIKDLESRTEERYNIDLNAIGTNVNPVIQEDDFVYRKQVQQMVNQMIQSYRSLYYNERHNCFLYDSELGLQWFDMCGNEFMAKYSIMNPENSTKVIMLHEKIKSNRFHLLYNNSVYNWLELGAPSSMLQKFHFILNYAEAYPESSFVRWGDDDIQIMEPLSLQHVSANNVLHQYSVFDNEQINMFLDKNAPLDGSSEYDKLIWKFINNGSSLTIRDVSLDTANALISSIKHIDTFLYTPMIIYIIRKILRMN